MKNVVGYIRVSTREQGLSRNGLDAQKSAIQAFCVANDFKFQFIESDVESGNSDMKTRAGLARAIQICKDRNCILVVAKLDRFSRSVEFISSMMNVFKRDKLTMYCADLGTDTDPFMLHLYAALAEKERTMISERTKAALKVLKDKGVKLGNPNLDRIAHLGRDKQRRTSIAYAGSLKPLIEPLISRGMTNERIASELVLYNVKTRNGCNFTTNSVAIIRRKWNKSM